MAKLYITEYGRIGNDRGNLAQVPMEPSIATQVLDFSGGAQQSVALNADTVIVSLKADAACHYLFGDNPTADTNDDALFANTPEFKGVEDNSGLKISVISA